MGPSPSTPHHLGAVLPWSLLSVNEEAALLWWSPSTAPRVLGGYLKVPGLTPVLAFAQLYQLDADPGRKLFLDDLFVFMQKRGECLVPSEWGQHWPQPIPAAPALVLAIQPSWAPGLSRPAGGRAGGSRSGSVRAQGPWEQVGPRFPKMSGYRDPRVCGLQEAGPGVRCPGCGHELTAVWGACFPLLGAGAALCGSHG